MNVKIPQFPWYGDTELDLRFPDAWKVVICDMAGKDAPKLSETEIEAAFSHPFGTPRLAELARNKKEVVILFEDLSRPTKIYEFLPYVLKELEEAGIKDDNIRFIAALGTHGALRLIDFIKKLGPDIPGRFAVYNHNPYENCTPIGTTTNNTPVAINKEVMACDLKIGIGCITPHPLSGFGGGAKILFPGVAGMDGIQYHHSNIAKRKPPTVQNPTGKSPRWGEVDDNEARLDLEESARMAGLDIVINAVVNMHRDTVGLFVGDMVKAHREGVKLARKIYHTPIPKDPDVIIANAYCKANEGTFLMGIGNGLLREDGGDLVIICNIPDGQVCHYLLRSFGKDHGGKLYGKRTRLLPRIRRLIVLGPYIDRAGIDWLGPAEHTIMAKDWTQVIDLIVKKYGEKAKIAVIPDGTLQHFPELWERL
jgi:nickel-dependent lactate racemase